MSAHCRLAGPADIPTIHALLLENAAHDGGDLRGTEASLRQYGFGPDPRFRTVLGQTGDQVLGLSLFFPEYSSWRGTVGLFVQDLYVRPAARGRGLGRGLLAASLRAAADWQPTFLTLLAHHHNATGRAFYAAQGFVQRAQADMLVCEGDALARLLR